MQQPHRGSSRRRSPQGARLARGAALAGSVVLLPLATACSGGESDAAARSGPTKISATEAGVVAPARIEVIAGLTGCTAQIRVEANELREGVCHTEQGDYTITTFPAEKYKLTWLDAAYTGEFLVGTRWVVSAPAKLLEEFRPKLGGTIQEPAGTGSTPAPSTS
ncbi:hypothetical protein [Streptomyces sp. HUAS ZL42]|uniref:hypothetical protein n=1 Tax=Streptomyces sp. HUAS ZL42 TaxID=3231715 RepID=UPI00345E12E1